MILRRLTWLALLLALLLQCQAQEDAAQTQPQHKITVYNGSGGPLNVFWIHPDTKELQQLNAEPLPHDTTTPYWAFIGHEFELHQLECPDPGECRRAVLKVQGEAEFWVDDGFSIQRPNRLKVWNQSRNPMDVYWVSHQGEASKLNADPVPPGEVLSIDGKTNHLFEVRQLGPCEHSSLIPSIEPCKAVRFWNPDQDEPTVSFDLQYQVIYEEQNVGIPVEENNNQETRKAQETAVEENVQESRKVQEAPVERPNQLRVVNQSEDPLDVYWVNEATGETTKLSSPVPLGESLPINGQTNHLFEARQSGSCEHSQTTPCKRVRFRNPNDDEVTVTITQQYEALYGEQNIGIPMEEEKEDDEEEEIVRPNQLTVWNQSEDPMEVYWINSETGEAVNQNIPVLPGEALSINGQTNHIFEARQIGDCENCKTVRFKNPDHDEPTVVISKHYKALFEEQDVGIGGEDSNNQKDNFGSPSLTQKQETRKAQEANTKPAVERPNQLRVVNQSEDPMDVYWVNEATGETTKLSSPVPLAESLPINGITNHLFEARQSGSCQYSQTTPCKKVQFRNPNDDEVTVTITQQYEALYGEQNIGVLMEEEEEIVRPNKLIVLNQSEDPMEVFWINSETGEAVNQNIPVPPGEALPINGQTNHIFEARQIGDCSTCKTVRFKNPDHDEPTVVITKHYKALFEAQNVGLGGDDSNNQEDKFGSSSLTRVLEVCRRSQDPHDCVQHNLELESRILQEEADLEFEHKLRENLAMKLENYTCFDDSLETSAPIRIEQWTQPTQPWEQQQQNQTQEQEQPSNETSYEAWEMPEQASYEAWEMPDPYEVQVLFDRPAARIHYIKDFIGEEECRAMEEAAEGNLTAGVVADGKGGLRISDHRKAMQAAIVVPWVKEQEGNPIAKLSRRVYNYANHVLDMGIEEHGQEWLMSIQYEGRGFNDTAPDRYKPHCDGGCEGYPHKHGTRVATMVMYCTLPTKGGHTNFMNANVHIKPEKYGAIFFSYIDPKTMLMDKQFTAHSGCPVWEGEKKIVTQWIRYGVDEENPHSSFNSMGVQKEEADNW